MSIRRFWVVCSTIMAVIIDKGIGNRIPRWFSNRERFLLTRNGWCSRVAIIAQYFAAKAATGFYRRCETGALAKIHTLASRNSVLGMTLTDAIDEWYESRAKRLNIALRLLLRSPFIVGGAIVIALLLWMWKWYDRSCRHSSNISSRRIRLFTGRFRCIAVRAGKTRSHYAPSCMKTYSGCAYLHLTEKKKKFRRLEKITAKESGAAKWVALFRLGESYYVCDCEWRSLSIFMAGRQSGWQEPNERGSHRF